MRSNTQEVKKELIKMVDMLTEELSIKDCKFNHIHEIIGVIKEFDGDTLGGLFASIKLLIDIFPTFECDEVRMKTERFINRINNFITVNSLDII